MAVFTRITQNELQQWLSNFSCGELLSYEGIESGIENTNYFVNTTQGRFVLTLFEKLTASELPFYLQLMQHLAQHKLPVAYPIQSKHQQLFLSLKNKPAALVACLPGQSIHQPNAQQCHAIGQFAAKAHLAVHNFKGHLINPRNLTWISQAATELRPYLPDELRALLLDEIEYQTQTSHSEEYKTLAKGAVHCDLFRDNALLQGDHIGGVIDFYFAGIDTFLYDLCVIANDWCICQTSKELQIDLTSALIQGYSQFRTFSSAELALWPAQLRLAALRFWTSRLYDYYMPRQATVLNLKDPTHFQTLLQKRQHQQNTPSLQHLTQLRKST